MDHDFDASNPDLSAFSGDSAAYLESLYGEEPQQPSWKRDNWPIAEGGELVSALDGNWDEVEAHVGEKLKSKAAKSGAGFTDADYDRRIYIDQVYGLAYATIPEMLDILTRTYCSSLGFEFMHISKPEEKSWLQERIEGPDKGVDFTDMGKKAILQKLIEAEGFEQFIDVKYKGTKRFGLVGADSLIPALEQIF